MPVTSTRLVTAQQYVKDLTHAIDDAEYRVNIMALVVAEDVVTQPIIDALCRASERGVHVSVAMDLYFTYKYAHNPSRWSYLYEQSKKMRATKRKLEANGATVRWLGQYGVFFFARRTHTKWSIVDDTVYSFGGINMFAGGIESHADYLLCISSKRLAERLSAEHDFILLSDSQSRSYPSHSFPYGRNRVLVDGGQFLDSIIYKRAVELAKQSVSAVYVSQYCPTGRLAKELATIDTTYFFNPITSSSDWLNRMAIRIAMFRSGAKSQYSRKKYLHAKCIIFTKKDGTKIALTGSHNFVVQGGRFGTREVALETKDQKIITLIEEFILDSVASTSS